QLVWIKPSGMTGKNYPSGFTNEITIAGVADGTTKSSTPSSSTITGNRNLMLAGGGLAAPVTIPIRIDANNRVTNLGTNKLTLSISTSTGLFRGSVVDPRSGKPVLFQGALFNDWDGGLGYFLNTGHSGQAMLTPQP